MFEGKLEKFHLLRFLRHQSRFESELVKKNLFTLAMMTSHHVSYIFERNINQTYIHT